MESRSRGGESQVLSFKATDTANPPSSAGRPGTGSSRPTTGGGRSKKSKLSEFRQYLEKEELPLLIETRNGARRVSWTANLEHLDYAHFLPVCLSGLQEKLEPYPSFAFEAAMGLLESGRCDTRVLKALPQVVQQIKSALGTHYYRSLLPLCNILQDKHLGTGDSSTKEFVAEALEVIEAYGKDDAHLMIQQYVPTFESCCGA
ncbi:hypothetical protein PHYBOEH_011372 [Phytophthora boehmeriae]|uniref:Uncharacterized protein n=1 Tax=Phytophthora boehmeriae TaxID=109152 RepID=A0A8T1X1D2_9STRA|nr:hypothetical protein PHYBOEH_011372 [Phytophthora boehmeriae]